MIQVSAPCKVHLLGEWAVVWGKPALLTTVDLRIRVILNEVKDLSRMRVPNESGDSSLIAQNDIRRIIEPIIKKELQLKKIPPYNLTIDSQIPMGVHLGTSAAISATYIAALLLFLKVKWDFNLINKLAYEAEKVFQGKPSGADNSTVVYGGLVWFRKESEDLKIIQQLPFSLPSKLSKNIIFINTGKPKEITAQMVKKVSDFFQKKPKIKEKFLDRQEKLVRELFQVLRDCDEKEFIRIIKEGEANLETIGVCSPEVKKIIRQIEKSGGAAKICGAGAFDGPTGVLLCYDPKAGIIEKIAKENNLTFFKTSLGVEGLRRES